MSNDYAAKLPTTEHHNASQPRNREIVCNWTATTIYKGKIVQPITLRMWMGRSNSANRVEACIWISSRAKHTGPRDVDASGKGQASGYGYCKMSAAADDAINSAGVELSRIDSNGEKRKRVSVGGTGMSEVKAALVAICRAMGYRGEITVIGHA